MDFEEAVRVRNQIAAFLNVDGTNRRAPGAPRIAIGIAPGNSATMLKIAIRAPSEKELERALGEGIAKEINEMAGYEVDIQITGEIAVAPAQPSNAASTLTIGASVGHYNCTAGSLGFFAQRLSDSAIGFVSNNHVIADCDMGMGGDDILHPAPADSGTRANNVIAELVSGYPPLKKNGAVVDAAFARLRDGAEYDPSTIGASVKLQALLVPLYKQRQVLKVGRSTGLTRGRITAFALQNLDVQYPALGERIRFDRQIEIAAEEGAACFSRPGDSGSLVVNPDGNPIGLLFAGNHDGSFTYANPIADVLRELDIRLLT